MMKKELNDFPVNTEIRVEWRNMDAAGIVHNTIYLGWVETARLTYFEHLDFNLVPETGSGLVVGYIDCKFIAPVTYPDTIIAAASVTELHEDHLIQVCHLYSKKHHRLMAISHQKLVFYDYQKGKKGTMPEGLKEQILALEGSVGT